MKNRYLLVVVAMLLPPSVIVSAATLAPAAGHRSESTPTRLHASGRLANHFSNDDEHVARERRAGTGQAAVAGRQAVRVRSGDTLWAIASRTLRTNDEVLITRFWRRIYWKNRNVIGRDPNVLSVGQILKLPHAGVRNVLSVGQILELPRAEVKAVTATQSRAPRIVSAGASTGQNQSRIEVAVRNGNTLWSIATWALRTNQNEVVADYLQLMYRVNRREIGPDPSLLYSGQVLVLPRPVRSAGRGSAHLRAALVTPQPNADGKRGEKQRDAKTASGQAGKQRSREPQLKSPQAGSTRLNQDRPGAAFDVLPDRISRLLPTALFAGSFLLVMIGSFLLLMMLALWLLSRPSGRGSSARASRLVDGQAVVTDKSSGGTRSAEENTTSEPVTEGAPASERHLLEVEAKSFESRRQTEEDLAGQESAVPSRKLSGFRPPPLDVYVPQLIRNQSSLSKLNAGDEDAPRPEAEAERVEPQDQPWWRFLLLEK